LKCFVVCLAREVSKTKCSKHKHGRGQMLASSSYYPSLRPCIKISRSALHGVWWPCNCRLVSNILEESLICKRLCHVYESCPCHWPCLANRDHTDAFHPEPSWRLTIFAAHLLSPIIHFTRYLCFAYLVCFSVCRSKNMRRIPLPGLNEVCLLYQAASAQSLKCDLTNLTLPSKPYWEVQFLIFSPPFLLLLLIH
jgi:hypothetical protein